jgi:uncharacterized membrane protein
MMKALTVILLVAAASTGCNKSSEAGGRAGTDTFRVKVPAMAQSVKQGEVATIHVSVERSSEFKQAVKLEIKAPPGIAVEPGTTTIAPGDKGEVQLKITAAKDAPIGDGRVLVRAIPAKGEAAETEFAVSVKAS